MTTKKTDTKKARPQPQSLPGMENRALEDLRAAALEYADIRDQRQALTAQEVALKAKVLGLMKAHKRSVYEYEGIEIRIVVEEETVKVKIDREALGDIAVSAGGPKNVQLAPDAGESSNGAGDGKVQRPVETEEEKAAFGGDPRASSTEERAQHYPKKA